MTAFSAELTITSWWPSPVGGGVAIGDAAGALLKAAIPAAVASRDPRPGEIWRITGPRSGDRIQADVALPMLPSGAEILRWMAASPDLPGVGRATAAKIWQKHGSDLYRILGDGDVQRLADTVPVATASLIISAFGALRREVQVLEAYDRVGVSASTAITACRLWGDAAVERLKADPYSIAALEPWRDVDERGLRMGVAPDDPRRIVAAVEEAMASRFRTRERVMSGHTAATRSEVEKGTGRLLNGDGAAARRAFELATDGGVLLETGGFYQARAPWRMERDVERAVRVRTARGRHVRPDMLDAAFVKVREETGVDLSHEQRDAVNIAIGSGFSVIDGAAGTGKSTVTRAIRHYAELVGGDYHQMALSGRAAKRLAEATGAPAMTVHRFLKAVTSGKLELRAGIVLIDEVSMLGLPDLWQVLSWTPAEVDVVVVGDPGQLPPISAGNPLQALATSRGVPRRTLTIIRRQEASSGIPEFAGHLRRGVTPELSEFDEREPDRAGVHIVACPTDMVGRRVLDVFEKLVGAPSSRAARDEVRRLHASRVQILGATRQGAAGVVALSDAIERRWMSSQPRVHDWGLAEGSKILWTRNSYDQPVGRQDENGEEIVADIMNGALGIVQRRTEKGAVVLFDDADGTKAEIRRGDLDRVQRGWAVTVHKSQGSAFDTIIMPVAPSRLLDRLLVYTAITRARYRAIIVGDPGLLREAVERRPRSTMRRQCLDFDRVDALQP